MHQPNPLAFALNELAKLQHDDPRLSVLTREANLYTTVLREQGLRTAFSTNDLKQLFTRMLDLMQVVPYEDPATVETGHATDLDQLEASIARVEGKAPPGSPAFKLPQYMKKENGQ